LHLAVAPVGSVLSAAADGADLDAEGVLFAAVVAAGADCDAPEGAGVAAGAVAAAEAGAVDAVAAVVLVAFCTPPWPLHAPRPVAAEVVPSLQVVGLGESAYPGIASANINNGAARTPTKYFLFMTISPLLDPHYL
jgi:hypothetical protein